MEQGKQDLNCSRQGLRRREQRGQWHQVLRDPLCLLELLVLGEKLQMHCWRAREAGTTFSSQFLAITPSGLR